jgi:hypothetical protein
VRPDLTRLQQFFSSDHTRFFEPEETSPTVEGPEGEAQGGVASIQNGMAKAMPLSKAVRARRECPLMPAS